MDITYFVFLSNVILAHDSYIRQVKEECEDGILPAPEPRLHEIARPGDWRSSYTPCVQPKNQLVPRHGETPELSRNREGPGFRHRSG